ncbi:MAG: GNAT family N-acetyltransferase [Chloroflexi bacterium]|nr:GNAT family N-acetyltransferase [Chloroflexota bacterium]
MNTLTPLCHDERIAIRPYVADDAPGVYTAVQESAESVGRWLPDLGGARSLPDVESYIAAQLESGCPARAHNYVIVACADGAILGGCGLTEIVMHHRFANMYYWVRASRLGEGIAPRAIRLLARHGFETLGFQRVELVIAVGNAASVRAADKAGALREGILRNRIYLHTTTHDAYIYSLVCEDFGLLP